ncbi:MAG TPA: SAM-dependent methyltransferase [Candidatus Polarisedimenticolia bacterium]|nr:SAM-dependent methyltransferase [Candidatus Polarisedimenticolia bacterium]
MQSNQRRVGGRAPVTLDTVVPWGRSFDEYVRMFDLTEADLQSRILDCAAGPASFSAEMCRRGRSVVACDPIYRFSATDISRRIDETSETILRKTAETHERFVWTDMRSPDHMGKLRMAAMRQFLEDLPAGIATGRYQVCELPSLPFRDQEFDLALCSHFLFTYSDILMLDFHLASIREMCRVAREARIFPLLPSFGQAYSPHVQPVLDRLRAESYHREIRRVPYEFQKGGNEMLRISRFKS